MFHLLKMLPRKLKAQAKLLRRDPQAFANNLMQVTHPGLFRERLVDIMNALPTHIRVDPALKGLRLNILNSALTANGMTGGPNTIVNLAVRIARAGVPVRLVTTVPAENVSAAWMKSHLSELVGGEIPDIPIETAADAAVPLVVGPDEVFMATHWSTAQQLKPVLARMRVKQFLYMLQEFEAAFYAWSSNHALALETYGMDFWPVVNESLLADYLFDERVGRFADAGFRERLTVFEPAIESRVFRPPTGPAQERPRRLLFYARPSNQRNLFGLGLEALRHASAEPSGRSWGGMMGMTLINLVCLGKSWTWEVFAPGNAPYWSINYEAWYYVAFGFAFYLTAPWRAPALGLTLMLAGPKIMLLLPIWAAGVLLFRYRARLVVSPMAATALLVTSLLLFALASYAQLTLMSREWLAISDHVLVMK